MAWTIRYNGTLRIVEAVFTGSATGPDLRQATTKAIALLKEQGKAKALVDLTELESGPSVFDIYDLPDEQYDKEGLSRRVRIALVEPRSPRAREASQFFETACVNRGWRVQSFPSHDAAIEWLTDTDFPNMPDAGDDKSRA